MNSSDIDNKHKLNIDYINISILIVLCLFFFGICLIYGTPVYNDSDQYIAMHVHREPVYPLFLYLIRCITPSHFKSVASILQSVLCIYASYRFVTYIRKTFDLRIPGTCICTLIVLTPYIITPLFSKLHIMMSIAIMSESVAIPLFILLVINLYDAFIKSKINKMLLAFLISLVLTLTRSQMIFTFILWFIMAVIMVCMRKPGESHKTGKAEVSPVADRFMGIIVCLIIMIRPQGCVDQGIQLCF